MSDPVAYRCPHCKAVSHEAAWEWVEEYDFCADCNDWHGGDKCPACGEITPNVGPPYRKRVPPPPPHRGPVHVMGPSGPIEVRTYLDPD